LDNKEVELTAYCGLYCGDCIRYRSRAADLARGLLNELRTTEFGKYAGIKSRSMKELESYEQCCQVLEVIIELQCPQPCRVGGGCPTFSCEILVCCQSQGYQGCWECSNFEECEKFEFLNKYHGDTPVQNLRKIRELGVGRWVKYRQKFFVWQ